MYRNIFFGLFFILTLICFSSCDNENDATKVVMTFKSGPGSQTSESGNKLLYEIETYSIVSNIKKFTISSFDSENGNIVLIDTVPDVPKFYYSYVYEVPEFSKNSITVTLRIRAIDANNNSQEFTRIIEVKGGSQILQPLTGIVLNSGRSGKPDALSLNKPSEVFLSSLADSSQMDIYAYHIIGEENNTTLSREWRTNTNVKFVKVNSFDYASATSNNIRNTYASLTKQQVIENLQPNDILLIGRDNNAWGAIQITDVVDNTGVENDYYRFDVKIIQ